MTQHMVDEPLDRLIASDIARQREVSRVKPFEIEHCLGELDLVEHHRQELSGEAAERAHREVAVAVVVALPSRANLTWAFRCQRLIFGYMIVLRLFQDPGAINLTYGRSGSLSGCRRGPEVLLRRAGLGCSRRSGLDSECWLFGPSRR